MVKVKVEVDERKQQKYKELEEDVEESSERPWISISDYCGFG